LNGLHQDLRYALRQLRKNPEFAAIAVLMLSLGIGTSTAMYAVLNAVLLRPLPFPNPGRLVRIFSTQRGSVFGPSPLDLRDFAAQNQTFEQLAVYDVWRKNVSNATGSIEPEQMRVGLVSAEYFEVLGLQPLLGRLFRPEENQWGNQFEVILGHNFWETRFRGDPGIVGKTIRINDEPYTVIGVMPSEVLDWAADARGKVELWTPFVPYLASGETVWDERSRGSRGAYAIGRLKPGVSIPAATADLERIAGKLAAQHPLDRGVSAVLRPLQEDRIGNLRPAVLLLMSAVILILLIACSNVANLLLARNSGRTREIALRVAMGAARFRLIRQFATENLALGLTGGLIGCILAWCSCEVLAQVHPAKLPQLATVAVDPRVLGFALAISILSTLLFGILPAWAGMKVNPSESFKEGGRSNIAARDRHWLRRSFVAAEMALAVMLLIGTGLLVQSLWRLENQQPGFRADHLLVSDFFLPPVHYPTTTSITRFSEEYVVRVRQSPGVEDASISEAYPPNDQWMQSFTIPGRPISRLEETPSAARNVTDTHYLHTLGIPLLRGRSFTDTDTEKTVPVALVNQAFVDRYFPAEDPLGKLIRMGLPPQFAVPDSSNIIFTIVGVIGNTTNRGLALSPLPHITTLYRQTPDLNVGFKNLIVRTAIDPLQLAAPIRQQLHALDASLPFAAVASMDQVMQQQTADRRYTTGLLSLFTVCGLALAGIGVYGVVSYVVAQRTSEIGLRMALGAQRVGVLWMVVKQGLGMAFIGAVVGLFAAWILRQTVAQLVFGISTADPTTFLAASLFLVGFATAASYVPARRAASIDPMLALRFE
jgi:putative ABC transport system permease protein